ncbi:uncharacterized protein LOC129289892 [Prosopis cineraria]|uniref:uncharacterized protein LOC129289892 n=1 Tax=Prosopis cineraria TaxID=364024 RepID=UPI00240FE089|nr:uncharacterized protein LOC129289892 [Prosopis cineraria]
MDIENNSSSEGTENSTPNSNNPTPNSINPPTSHNDSISGTPSFHGKKDPTWAYVVLRKEGNKNVYTCLYCVLSYKGGGINRLKHHLAGVTGNVISCSKVPFDIRHQMQESLKSRKKRKFSNVQADMEEHVSNANEPNAPTPSKSIPKSSASKRNLILFQLKIILLLGQLQARVKGPNAYEFRVNLLNDWKKECQLLIESHRSKWKTYGCTLMADVFVKSVDASDLVKDVKTLFSLFFEVIEWVGPKNIVHVVTDNAANYIAYGKLIKDKYESIYWSPRAAHCLNLILKDIANMSHVSQLATKASKITVFIYNHMVFLSWLRKRKGWKEIVRPGVTRTEARIIVSAIILDNQFWNECLEVVKIVSPLIKLLRIVDLDEKPSLPYVYEGMQRAKKAIKAVFNNKKDQYKPYIDIIQARWDKHLKTNLHVAAYLLNPAFLYDDDFVHKRRLMDAMLSVFESTKNEDIDYIVMMKQLSLYRDHKESFDKASCHRAVQKLEPYEWWSFYGSSVPELQNLTMHILSQTSSSFDYFWIAEEEQEPAPKFDADDVTNMKSAMYNENVVASSAFERNNEGEEDINIPEHPHLIDDVGSDHRWWVINAGQNSEIKGARTMFILKYHDNYTQTNKDNTVN